MSEHHQPGASAFYAAGHSQPISLGLKISMFVFLLLLPLATLAQMPETDIFLLDLKDGAENVSATNPRNLSAWKGYDNQPFFISSDELLFSSARGGKEQIDIYRYKSGQITPLVQTEKTSEFSPTWDNAHQRILSVRVEEDGTQRLWGFSSDGKTAHPILDQLKGVGYYLNLDGTRFLLFVVGDPHKLVLATTVGHETKELAADIGRSILSIPGRNAASFVKKHKEGPSQVMEIDLATFKRQPLVDAPEGAEDTAWTPGGWLLMAKDAHILAWHPQKKGNWQTVADLSGHGISGITRLAIDPTGKKLAIVAKETSSQTQ